jgi:aminoglycoside N3'-acetyltransferase
MLNIDLKNLKPPYLIHSDIFKTFGYIKDDYKVNKVKINPLELHFNILCKLFSRDNIIFPSFNYDFPKTKFYDTKLTNSQVGALTNYILKKNILYRTKTPIFSFLTNISDLLSEHNLPFSSGSIFDFINKNDGTIIFYGAEISSCTFLHYVENQFGPPVFRYDKKFLGTIFDNQTKSETFVEFHVRPFGLELDYNWDLLLKLLVQKNALHKLSNNFFAVKAKDVSNIWGNFFVKNQFDILSTKTKDAIIDKFNIIGRRFVQKDFEINA